MKDLIISFATLRIEPADPPIQGMPPTPCPISTLPDELLVHILQDVAVDDVGDYMRLSQVCKHLAYLVITEPRVWRRVCMGSEFGFTGMHYRFQKGIEWDELEDGQQQQQQQESNNATTTATATATTAEDGTFLSPRELAEQRHDEALSVTRSLVPSVYPSWQKMFRSRPRIRFNGCYISTVNYIRTGQASTNQNTWGSAPIHIVTYYRYLRFFRDGTLISLLSTAEPADVVHHLTRDLLHLHRAGVHAHLPSAMMRHGLKGRWRLSSPLDCQTDADATAATAVAAAAALKGEVGIGMEDDLYVETEGVGSKYIYRMDLSLRSAGRGSRNNKFVWRGFWSYNKLTDDWAEFGLKNDKPFLFSRVKSYGNGE